MAASEPQIRVPVPDLKDADCDSGPVSSGTFYSVIGAEVELSKGYSEAAIVIEGYRPVYDRNSKLLPIRRLVFSSEPIKVNDNFQVYVSRRKCKVDPDGHCEFLSDSESGPYFIPHHDIVS